MMQAARLSGVVHMIRAFAKRGERESIAVFKARRYSERPAFLEQANARLYPGLRKAGFAE
jgi:hypothetical protein